MVLELIKHVEEGALKLAVIGVSQVIQVTGLHEIVQWGNMERRE